MLRKLALLCITSFLYINSFADPSATNSASTTNQQSSSQTSDDYYSGNIGTGVNHKTVSAAGGAVEFAPSAANIYVFFTQTLSNDIYYEGRLYTRDNYNAQNPLFPSVPVSNENNPWGYGAVVKFGYDFHPTELIDIVPYLRLNAYDNMGAVYEDSNGDSIHSTTYSILPGVKLAYKVTRQFNPYVELYGGWQQVNLSGNFPQSKNPGTAAGTVTQNLITYEIGFSSKLSRSIALIPYMQYITTASTPNGTASAPYTANGFNISSLTSTQQVYGLKLAVSW